MKLKRQRFSRLFRCLAQEDTKVVVTLGGGGIRMFGHAAVLKCLEELGAEPYISEIWGASGGAIVGLLYAMGFTADQIKEEGLNLYREYGRLPILPSIFTVLKKLMIESAFKNDQTVKGFIDCNASLQALIARTLKRGRERYPFYCVAYNMGTNQNDVLTSAKIPKGIYDGVYRVNPLEAVVASSAIPVLFVPKVIQDHYGKRVYADGAMIEDVPTASLYKKWLRDREVGLEKRKRLLVIAINLNPYFASWGLWDNWLIRKLPGYDYLLLSVHCADFMREARTEAQKKVLLDDPHVELWDLSLNMPGGGLLNVSSIPKVIEVAERTFPRQLAKINNTLMG